MSNQDIIEVLINLVQQADEDMPHAYRTDHFNTALDDAIQCIKKNKKKGGANVS